MRRPGGRRRTCRRRRGRTGGRGTARPTRAEHGDADDSGEARRAGSRCFVPRAGRRSGRGESRTAGRSTVRTPVTRSQMSARKKPASDWLAYQRAMSAAKAAKSQCTARRPRSRTLSAMASARTAQNRMVLGRRSCTAAECRTCSPGRLAQSCQCPHAHEVGSPASCSVAAGRTWFALFGFFAQSCSQVSVASAVRPLPEKR